ncbi:MAG: class I SAM-dependent methyltransferase [Flavobacteriales bacterium]|nr:class I SAM-dependent methyltransferase [Flavobacteriales bacterium]
MNQEEKNKMYFYESFSEEFDSKMNMYDTNKRLSVFYDELLTEDLKGKKILDAGCGTGWFSKGASDRGADVTSMDLGEGLLKQVEKKCKSTRVVGSILEMPFEDNSFDVVVSSEVIEHIPEPLKAIDEIYRVLKPGGIVILSTPNRLWFFTVWLANKLKLRPYQGLENWISWNQLKRKTRETGFEIDQMVGIHILPFVHPIIYPVLNFFHKFNKALGPLMINMAIKAKKV